MRTWARRSLEGAAASALGALRRRDLRVGWVAADTLDGGPRRLSRLHPPVSMRVTNTAFWIEAHRGIRNELYRPERRYDVVVFFKAMSERDRDEARRIQAYGGRVIFDANVNYYEIWGDYDVDRTQPTEGQQAAATEMTQLADWVVADSSYLLGVVRRLTERASWIPDNVDLRVFRARRSHRARGPLRLVWSGVAQKADHLLEIVDVLAQLRHAELCVVSDRPPDALAVLREALPCSYAKFSESRYARLLRQSDVIVSPKRLSNAYELAHTEYKISLGMAVGLPALASPQQSYVEAVSHLGGGFICADAGEWLTAFERVGDPAVRAQLGGRARRTVVERYSTPVTAASYADLIERLVR